MDVIGDEKASALLQLATSKGASIDVYLVRLGRSWLHRRLAELPARHERWIRSQLERLPDKPAWKLPKMPWEE